MTRKFRLLGLITVAVSVLANVLMAASADKARITQIGNQVQLMSATGAHVTVVNEIVAQGTIVRTGKNSHAELTFSDQTVVRLAANTTFTFQNGTRDLKLVEGAALIEAPNSAKGAEIHAGNVSVAVTGTTAMLEYHGAAYKFLVLEGTGRLYRPGHLGDSVLVRPGQLVFGNPNAAVSDPADFDIGRFVKTSRFIVDLPPLPSGRSITLEAEKQQREKAKKTLVETNLVIFGGGTRVSVVGQSQTNAGGRTTPAPGTSQSAQ